MTIAKLMPCLLGGHWSLHALEKWLSEEWPCSGLIFFQHAVYHGANQVRSLPFLKVWEEPHGHFHMTRRLHGDHMLSSEC